LVLYILLYLSTVSQIVLLESPYKWTVSRSHHCRYRNPSSDWSCSSLTTHVLRVLCISSNMVVNVLNLSFNTAFETFPFTCKPSWFRHCNNLVHVSLV
jgi:hypothetical protein